MLHLQVANRNYTPCCQLDRFAATVQTFHAHTCREHHRNTFSAKLFLGGETIKPSQFRKNTSWEKGGFSKIALLQRWTAK